MQNYTLYNGDCLEYMKKLKSSSVDLIVTDPPYNLQTEGGCKGSIGKSLRKQGKDIEFIAK